MPPNELLFQWIRDGLLALAIIAFLRGWIWPAASVERALREKDAQIADRDKQITDRDRRIEKLEKTLDVANEELRESIRQHREAAGLANDQASAMVRIIQEAIRARRE